MAKGKSLLNQTPTKPKTKRSKKQTTDTSTPYLYSIGDELVYCGSLIGYENSECVIVGRSRKYLSEYYRIRFNNDDEIETIADILRTKEEFQQKEDEKKKALELKEKLAELGQKSINNFMSCHNQDLYYHRGCKECHHENECIYRYKYDYGKLKFN